MKHLYVLYDPGCALCVSIQRWLATEPAFVPIVPVAADSPWVAQNFPDIAARHLGEELVVVSDRGEAWWGDHAWLMCLYALQDFRAMALRLASPGLIRYSRAAFAYLSERRQLLSSLIGLRTESEIRSTLHETAISPRCVR